MYMHMKTFEPERTFLHCILGVAVMHQQIETPIPLDIQPNSIQFLESKGDCGSKNAGDVKFLHLDVPRNSCRRSMVSDLDGASVVSLFIGGVDWLL